MSFQGLISGADCAVASNPLSQVLKHAEGDRSLQQDRISGPSSSRLQHLPGTPVTAANEHDLTLARQFFETQTANPSYGPSPHLASPDYARVSELARNRSPQNPAWLIDQPNHIQTIEDAKMRSSWANEFPPAQMNAKGPVQIENAHSNFQQQPSYINAVNMYSSSFPVGMGMYGMSSGIGMLQTTNGNTALISDQKGKGKASEADFEAAFAEITASLNTTQINTSKIEEVTDDAAQLAESETDFHKVWDDLQSSDLPPPKEDLAKWEAEFNQLMSSQREDLETDYGSQMQKAWEDGMGDFSGNGSQEAPFKFDSEGLPLLDDYIFEANNKYLETAIPSTSLLDDAKALLNQNGSLTEAGLLLEAAIQKGELGEGGYEAWILLGETRNMDEREEAGMRALTEGVKRAEAAGAPGAGMLSLAISYTNESYDKASHSMLLRWLRTRFPDLAIPDETIRAISTNSSWDTHTRITDLFLNVARSQHSQGIVDPDVQIGLGVLFYTNAEYDRAKDCFESALSSRPKDYTLWNRLGSSLSNGSKPEEALGAYREALQLRPTYTRAIYNVGVACLNIGAHKEAAEHFLSALALQESTGGDQSSQLWFTLRRAFLTMDRPDLADFAKPEAKTSLEVFRREGFDF